MTSSATVVNVSTESVPVSKDSSIFVRWWNWQKQPVNRTGPLFFACLCDAIVFISATQAAAEPLWAPDAISSEDPFRRRMGKRLNERHEPTLSVWYLTQAERALLWTVVALGLVKWILIVLRCLQFKERIGGIIEVFLVTMQLALSSACMALFRPRTVDVVMSLSESTFFITLAITIICCVPSLILRLLDFALGTPERISYAKRDFIVTTFATLVVLIAGAFIFATTEGWDYNVSLVFCVIAFTTIGYGNDTPSSDAGKILVITYGFVGVVIFVGYLLAIRNVLIESIELNLRPIMEERVRAFSKRRNQGAEDERERISRIDSGTIHYDQPKDVRRQDAEPAILDAAALAVSPPMSPASSQANMAKANGNNRNLEPLPIPLSPDSAEPDHEDYVPQRADTEDLANYWADRIETSWEDHSKPSTLPRTSRMDLQDIEEVEPVSNIREAWGAEVGQISAVGDPVINNGPMKVVTFAEDPMRACFNDINSPPAAPGAEAQPTRGKLVRTRRIDPGRARLKRRATWLSQAGDVFNEENKIQLWTDRTIALLMFGLTILWWLGGAGVFSALEGWNYLDSVYFCFVTVTTIGFGDIYPNTAGGWELFIYYCLLTVSLWGFLLTVIGNLWIHQNISLIDRATEWLTKFD